MPVSLTAAHPTCRAASGSPSTLTRRLLSDGHPPFTSRHHAKSFGHWSEVPSRVRYRIKMSNHVCEICRPRSFQHVHWAMKRKAFITVATARSPDPSCWYPRSHVGRSLPPYLALPPSVPPPRSLQPAALAFPLQSEDFAFPVPSRTSAFPPATPSAYSAAFTIKVQLAATRSLLKGHSLRDFLLPLRPQQPLAHAQSRCKSQSYTCPPNATLRSPMVGQHRPLRGAHPTGVGEHRRPESARGLVLLFREPVIKRGQGSGQPPRPLSFSVPLL